LVGIYHYFLQQPCLLFVVDMRILIDNALKHVDMLEEGKFNIMLTWTYTIVLDI